MMHERGGAAAVPPLYAVGPRRARIRDVAELAGVSMKTVSRVVNGESGVLPNTRERVETAVRDLGFVPDSRARSLKRGGNDTIGILIDAISDPFFAALVSVVEELALQRGLSVLFASTGYDGGRERAQLDRLTGERLSGLILAPVAVTADELTALRRRFPVLCVDREREGIDSIVVDDFGATVEAMGEFITRGHRRIGFIGDQTPYPTVIMRLAAYRTALAEAGLPYDSDLVVDHDRARGRSQTVIDLLSAPDAPTALFCASSPAAITVIQTIGTGGLRIPALISFGDFEFADVFSPGITCVDQDPRIIGEATFQRLVELLADPDAAAERIVVPTRLIRRGSGETSPTFPDRTVPIGALR